MVNKEELIELVKQEIEGVRERLIVQIDTELMGMYDLITEFINSDSETIINEETSELSELIASQIHNYDDDEVLDEEYDEEEEIEETDEPEEEVNADQVMNLATLLHEQVVSQAQTDVAEQEEQVVAAPVQQAPARRPLTEIVAELVASVNKEMDDESEVQVDSLLNPEDGEKVEDLSEKIKQAILENDIKKQ